MKSFLLKCHCQAPKNSCASGNQDVDRCVDIVIARSIATQHVGKWAGRQSSQTRPPTRNLYRSAGGLFISPNGVTRHRIFLFRRATRRGRAQSIWRPPPVPLWFTSRYYISLRLPIATFIVGTGSHWLPGNASPCEMCFPLRLINCHFRNEPSDSKYVITV